MLFGLRIVVIEAGCEHVGQDGVDEIDLCF